MVVGEVGQGVDLVRLFVDVGNVVELFVVVIFVFGQKCLFVFYGDFFECFQVIGGKFWVDDIYMVYFIVGQCFQVWLGVGLQLFGVVEM